MLVLLDNEEEFAWRIWWRPEDDGEYRYLVVGRDHDHDHHSVDGRQESRVHQHPQQRQQLEAR
ncbi:MULTISPECIES: hypothetical protein [Curtobacterium]|uniref:hypothetical protein n=1 Tax=Curtobacterium flaccumfaciens TaxID=2035 RepID=UPI003EE5AEB6